MTKKPFNVVLTADERDRLEAHRSALGLRSHADVVRLWIAGPVTSISADQARARLNMEMRDASAAMSGQLDSRQDAPEGLRSSVPFAGDVQRKPYQKGQKR